MCIAAFGLIVRDCNLDLRLTTETHAARFKTPALISLADSRIDNKAQPTLSPEEWVAASA